MKVGIVFASALILFGLCHSAHAQTDSPRLGHGFSSISDFHYNRFTYTYKLSTPDLDNTPSWNAQDTEPPLSLRKALDIARAGLQRFVKPGDQGRVDSIALRQLDFEKWIYDVHSRARRRSALARPRLASPFSLRWMAR